MRPSTLEAQQDSRDSRILGHALEALQQFEEGEPGISIGSEGGSAPLSDIGAERN